MTNELIWKEERRLLSDLKPYENNPRKISKKAFADLVESIKQDGYHNRLKVNTDNTVSCGNQRLKALKSLKYKEIEVLVPDRKLTEEEFKRIVIKDNLHAGEFDFDMLANHFEVEELLDWGMPEEWLGVEEPEIEVSEADEQVDGIDFSKQAISKYGDIWILGNHRLMCGDSTNATQVQDLIGDIKPILMVTDPPYGVNYDATWREGNDLGVGKRSKGKVLNDDKADWTQTYALFPGDVAYVWHASLYGSVVQRGLEDCGFKAISQIIWAKQHFALSRGDYHWQHEVCLYAVKESKKHNWQGARDQSTLWEIKNNNSFGNSEKEETFGHSTQKPIECMLRPILNNSAVGESVYDPFGGSGTTLIAAEKSNRRCLMMELSPHYCDVIVARWEKLTGNKAVLES